MSSDNLDRIERYIRALAPRRVTTAARLTAGVVCLEGIAKATRTLVAPVSQATAIGYRLVGQSAGTERFKYVDYTDVPPFELVFGSGGSVQVEPSLAEVLAWPPTRFKQSLASFAEDFQETLLNQPYPRGTRDEKWTATRWLEWRLEAGDQLTVVGRAQAIAARDGAGGSYRTAPRAWAIRPPHPHPVLLIVGPLEALSRRLPDETFELPLRFIVWGHEIPLRLEHPPLP